MSTAARRREQELISKLTSAYTAADLDRLIALLTDDVRLTMPPHPFEYAAGRSPPRASASCSPKATAAG